MKNYIHIACIGFLILLGACGVTQKVEKGIAEITAGEILPQQLKAENGMVDFDYVLNLSPKTVSRTQTLKITPIVKNGNQIIPLSPLFLQGQGVKHTYFPTVRHRAPFEMGYHYEIPWQPGMENAQIYTLTEISRCGKMEGAGEALLYDRGITPPPIPKIAPITTPKADLTGEIQGTVMFSISNSHVLSHKEYIKYLKQNLDTAMSYPGAAITSIELIVSCSPDGSAAYNEKLSKQRYQTARHYFEEQLQLNRFAAWSNPNISTHQIVNQNWQDLYYMLEDSHIPERQDIINKLKSLDDSARGKSLTTYMNRYPIIRDQYLPTLRNARIVIKYKMPWHEIKTVVVPGMW